MEGRSTEPIYVEEEAEKRYYGTTDIDGEKSYMVSVYCEGYTVATTFLIHAANENIGTMMEERLTISFKICRSK